MVFPTTSLFFLHSKEKSKETLLTTVEATMVPVTFDEIITAEVVKEIPGVEAVNNKVPSAIAVFT